MIINSRFLMYSYDLLCREEISFLTGVIFYWMVLKRVGMMVSNKLRTCCLINLCLVLCVTFYWEIYTFD